MQQAPASSSQSPETRPRLGIIAGGGALPRTLVETCARQGRPFFVVAFDGQTDKITVKDAPHVWVRLGDTDATLKKLKSEGVTHLVMAGSIRRPGIREIRPDLRTLQFFARYALRALGDDGLLRAVKAELEKDGFLFLAVQDIAPDLLAPSGIFGRKIPDEQSLADIARGVAVARALGAVDVGQSVVVQQGIVLGVEAAEGTDALLSRCSLLRRQGGGGVLVKMKKPQQAEDIDLPTIGPDTVRNAADSGLQGIAVEAGCALVIDFEKTVRTANDRELFLLGIAPDTADGMASP